MCLSQARPQRDCDSCNNDYEQRHRDATKSQHVPIEHQHLYPRAQPTWHFSMSSSSMIDELTFALRVKGLVPDPCCKAEFVHELPVGQPPWDIERLAAEFARIASLGASFKMPSYCIRGNDAIKHVVRLEYAVPDASVPFVDDYHLFKISSLIVDSLVAKGMKLNTYPGATFVRSTRIGIALGKSFNIESQTLKAHMEAVASQLVADAGMKIQSQFRFPEM